MEKNTIHFIIEMIHHQVVKGYSAGLAALKAELKKPELEAANVTELMAEIGEAVADVGKLVSDKSHNWK